MARKKNRDNGSLSKGVGIGLTVAFHLIFILIFSYTGLKAMYPPPPEHSILIEFLDDEIKPIVVSSSSQPRAQNADPTNEIRLVQRSEVAIESETNPEAGVETTVGEDGDIEVTEPERRELDRRALFSSANNRRDTIAAQVAERASDSLSAGHRDGNTRVGNTEGEPSAQLAGRTAIGSLPLPAYDVQKEGRVVVRILVDPDGNVTSAIPGVPGTSVPDKTLWEAAKQAALKAKFNVSTSAPIAQEGTITYNFKLK